MIGPDALGKKGGGWEWPAGGCRSVCSISWSSATWWRYLRVVAALMVWPFSRVLNAALFTLLGLFFATSLLAITQALIFVITG